MSKAQQITIKTNEQNPEPLELIAKSIIELSEAFKKIDSSPLKRHTIILLLKDQTGLPQRDIIKILDAAPKLAEYYVKNVK